MLRMFFSLLAAIGMTLQVGPLGAIEQVTHGTEGGGHQLVIKMWSGWELHLEMVGPGDCEVFGAEFAERVAAVED